MHQPRTRQDHAAAQYELFGDAPASGHPPRRALDRGAIGRDKIGQMRRELSRRLPAGLMDAMKRQGGDYAAARYE